MNMDTVSIDTAPLKKVLEEAPTPLFATISGAHLYGFDSPDSDIDLRGAFVSRLRDIIGLVPPELTKTITLTKVNNGFEIDFVAHDIHKFATLMTRRNGYVLEQLYSPLVVLGGPWHEELKEIGKGAIIRHLYHHYRGFYDTQRKQLEKEMPSLKDLLYAYRVLMTGIHVLQTGIVEANLQKLNERFSIDALPDLISRKKSSTEKSPLGADELSSHMKALEKLEKRLEIAFDESKLPDQVTTFAALDDFVIRARLALGAEQAG
jgi:predicted nucleotidyltransferase